MGYDKNKFKFSELFNNSDGKSSGSGFSGLLLILIGSLSFLISMIGYLCGLENTLEVMSYIVMILGIGSTLLGVRKVFGDKTKTTENEE